MIREYQVQRWIRGEVTDDALEELRQPAVVVMQEPDQLAACPIQREVKVGGHAGVRLVPEIVDSGVIQASNHLLLIA